MIDTVEKTTIRKIYVRTPAAAVRSVFHLLSRPHQRRLRRADHEQGPWLHRTVYAFGATAFFLGYCLFEVPSNIILEKVGARMWIARIMITWGLFSGATAFVTGADQLRGGALLPWRLPKPGSSPV